MKTFHSRRHFLNRIALGSGGLIASQYLPGGGVLAGAFAAEASLEPKAPHFEPKARSVIWLHQVGAPSGLDLFDYKPELIRLHGEDVPPSFLDGLRTATQGGVGKLIATNRRWKQYGESGAWFSDLLPHIAQHADDLSFIRSSVTVGATHDISVLKLNTSSLNPGRPTLGAWVQYALGSANPNLPAYVVLYNDNREPSGGVTNWNSGFLPAVYQGTPLRPGGTPILHLDNPALFSKRQERRALDLLGRLNALHDGASPSDTELRARAESFELAYRMQDTAPEAVDLSQESAATHELYGLNDPLTSGYGEQLLRARRLAERGVRFIQVMSGRADVDGDMVDWDAHTGLEANHGKHAAIVDKPIAGLLADLKQRGLLDSTLVVWTSEFGRSPWSESGNGRDHNAWGYTQWLAGGGVKAGHSYGNTDEIGLRANPGEEVDTYDLQATVLNQLGLDFKRVIFRNQGRSERPTTTFGRVVQDILA
ncbi:MAG TPA: DUF1501 domain-containing protein [Hyphomicrobiales bacterium]|nr:DUF1501 domain-containing protein [Hyphomicrobiales bacterium]